MPWPGAQPRWEEGLQPPVNEDIWAQMRVHPAPDPQRYVDEPQIYRRSRAIESASEPTFEEAELFELDTHMIHPVQLSHANLIEFPRELVAARKARPRLAEGPLYDPEQEDQQLNIFEAEPQQTSDLIEEASIAIEPPGWASIELDHASTHPHHDFTHAGHHAPAHDHAHEYHHAYAHAYAHAPELIEATAYTTTPAHHEYETEHYPESHFDLDANLGVNLDAVAQTQPSLRPLVRETPVRNVPAREPAIHASAPPEMLVASLSDRVLAGLVDGALVTLAFLAASVVVIASTAHPPAGRIAILASGCGLLLFGILYQFLFLSFTEEGTPGMRYARIALCTFDDENPTLGQMQMRVPALLLSTLPAGLGLLWSLWDKDHVCWHDRWTRTYQRKY
jgi:uncharacterized RDD family membrane protein YckC